MGQYSVTNKQGLTTTEIRAFLERCNQLGLPDGRVRSKSSISGRLTMVSLDEVESTTTGNSDVYAVN